MSAAPDAIAAANAEIDDIARHLASGPMMTRQLEVATGFTNEKTSRRLRTMRARSLVRRAGGKAGGSAIWALGAEPDKADVVAKLRLPCIGGEPRQTTTSDLGECPERDELVAFLFGAKGAA